MEHPLSTILYGLGALLCAALFVGSLFGMRGFWRIKAAQGCLSLWGLACIFLFLTAVMVLLTLDSLGLAPAGL